MKRRSVTRALALAMSLIMLSGEAMPAFAAGSEGSGTQIEETAALEETTEDDEEEASAEESVSEDSAVSEDAAVSENKAVSENEAVLDNEAEEEEASDEDSTEGDEDVPEEEISEATPDSDFQWNGNIITKYVGAATEVVIPARAIEIGENSFKGSAVTTVTFEKAENLVTIGPYAFNGCVNLKGFVIPSAVRKIGGHAFEGCTSITEITFPDGVILDGDAAFKNCTSLTTVKNVTGGIVFNSRDLFKKPTFEGCSALTVIGFAPGINKIPAELFNGCIALRSVTIPGSVSNIEKYAFYGCSALTDFYFESSNNLTEIGDYAFSESISLRNFAIPSSVKRIGGHAFEGCSSLTEITLPTNVLLNGDATFKNCSSLAAVKNITGGIVFKSRDLFKKPPFEGCTALSNLEFSSKMTKIPADLFEKCVSIRCITIPNSVKTIGANAFNGCTALREIHLPSKLKKVKESAFKDCISITEVYYGGKSSRDKIKRASEKNNDPLFAVEWIKENRSNEPATGELTVNGVKVSSLKAAFKLMNDKETRYVIELQSDLKGEKNLTIPKSAKSVTINGNGHVVEITGSKLTSNALLFIGNVRFRTTDKKGKPCKFTINAKEGMAVNLGVSFDTASTIVRSAEGVTVSGVLEAKSISCKQLSIAGTLKAVKDCNISVKKRLYGEGGAIELAEGFKPIKISGIVEGKVKFTGAKQAEGTQILKTSAKKVREDILMSSFDVSGINTSAIGAHLYYNNGKACIFPDAVSFNGRAYGTWKSAVAAMNAAQKEAKKNKTKASFNVYLNTDVDLNGKFLLPKKGYESITINGGGHSMKFTSDITLTGNTDFAGVVLIKVNKKGEQVKGKIKKGKFTLTGAGETF